MSGVTGRCACGAIRYALLSEPFDAGYCHCRMCQLTSGAPVMAFATVPIADFRLTVGEMRVRRSSDFGERGFCGDCGTPLTMHVDHQPDTIDSRSRRWTCPSMCSQASISGMAAASAGSKRRTRCRVTLDSGPKPPASPTK